MRRMIRAVFGGVVLGLVGAAATLALAARAPRPASPQTANQRKATSNPIEGYRNWKRVTPKPVYILGQVYYDCAQAPGGGSQETSPHDGGYITVFVSERGRRALLEEPRPRFPVGTVLVKEKRKKADDPNPELLTVMEKKPAGFAPKHGDWQYTVHVPAFPKLKQQSVAHCQKCHAEKKGTDYVFRSYLPEALRARLQQTATLPSR